ncbi:hypothetical protein JKP88DRAFT_346394 [Tribonema minus]|uniref:Patatin n=1 Tax=Tribonema minus TaxID=303371 RepID=A0A835ZL71_9STRA|nr:hypothetical protein JKP88DRAFT_346394 [Tribonema minus]
MAARLSNAISGVDEELSEAGQLALEALTMLDVFGSVQDMQLESVCRRAETVDVAENVPLLVQGQPLDDIFILDSGCVNVFVSGPSAPAEPAAAAAAAASGGSAHAVAMDTPSEGAAAAAAAPAPGHEAPQPQPPQADLLMCASTRGTVLLGLSDLLALLLPPPPSPEDARRGGSANGSGAPEAAAAAAVCASVTVTAATACRLVRIPNARKRLRALAAAAERDRRGGSGGSAELLRGVLARLHLVTMHCACLYLGLVHELLRPAARAHAAPPLPPRLAALPCYDADAGGGGGSSSGSGGSGSADVSGGGGGGSGDDVRHVPVRAQPPRADFVRAVVAHALGVHEKSVPPIRCNGSGGGGFAAAAFDNDDAAAQTATRSGASDDFAAGERARAAAAAAAAAAACVEVVRFEDGALLPLDGDSGPCMYVLIAGAAECRGGGGGGAEGGGGGPLYYRHGPGSTIGLLCLMTASTEEWYGAHANRSDGGDPVLSVRCGSGGGCGSGGSSGGGSGGAWLARIGRAAFDALMRRQALAIVARAGAALVAEMHPALRAFDFAAGYASLASGQTLVDSGAPGDCLYVVLHGRLRALPLPTGRGDAQGAAASQRAAAAAAPLRHFSRGALVGEAALISGTPHAHAVVATRPSLVARIPGSVLALLGGRYPRVVARLALHAAGRGLRGGGAGGDNIKSFAVLPCSIRAPLELFAESLRSALEAVGCSVKSLRSALEAVGCSVKLLTGALVASRLGLEAEDLDAYDMGSFVAASVSSHLAAEEESADVLLLQSSVVAAEEGSADVLLPQEESADVLLLQAEDESADILLLQADWHASTWTQLCCQHADGVLLVGNAADRPTVTQLERELRPGDAFQPDAALSSASCARAMRFSRTPRCACCVLERELRLGDAFQMDAALCLVHVDPPPGYHPTNTRAWFVDRQLNSHFHIRLQRGMDGSSRWHYKRCMYAHSDFLRVARCLCGKAVGLVLGGGGARGMAHVGLIRALEEQQIPVDYIAGTSIGALVGGLYAMDDSLLGILPRVNRFARTMSSTWGYVRDLTLPITSYFSGFGFNQGTQLAFGAATRIEDFWLTYLCVTTDLTTSSAATHVNGTAWRYVRASMSLAGYLPPICDLDAKGTLHLLIDGGYVNNLPADAMRARASACLQSPINAAADLPADAMRARFGAGTVIASDVGSTWTFESYNYGDLLNGLSTFFRSLWPFSTRVTIPSMAKISEQLAYISSVKQLEDAKAASDLYLHPPIDPYATLEFHKYKEIQQLVHRYVCCLRDLTAAAATAAAAAAALQVGYAYAAEAVARWRESTLCHDWQHIAPAHRQSAASHLWPKASAATAAAAAAPLSSSPRSPLRVGRSKSFAVA